MKQRNNSKSLNKHGITDTESNAKPPQFYIKNNKTPDEKRKINEFVLMNSKYLTKISNPFFIKQIKLGALVFCYTRNSANILFIVKFSHYSESFSDWRKTGYFVFCCTN